MPKYLKDTKIEYWKKGGYVMDNEGVARMSDPTKAGDLWCNFKGKDFSAFYAAHAKWAEPVFQATFTRPGYTVEIDDFIYHDGKFYKIKSIDDLSGHPHSDVKVTVQYNTNDQKQLQTARNKLAG